MRKESELDCYLFYFWNAWNQDECLTIFGKVLGGHLWSKWEQMYDEYGAIAAPAPFFAQHDHGNRDKVVRRAVEYYN